MGMLTSLAVSTTLAACLTATAYPALAQSMPRPPVGTPVYASKSGIAFCGNVPTGYGKFVLIYQPDGMQTMYGHLSNWNVSTGKKVRRGDVIGFVGKTGNAASASMQPHLHFEIRKYVTPLNPLRIIR